jgi:hypothetical protein
MAASASAATTDPEVIIYRFPGVRDNGGIDGAGIATAFHCTNFSGVNENIRFVTRDDQGVLVSNGAVPVGHLQTRTVTTKGTAAYPGIVQHTGLVDQGTTAIAATSINLICTAMTVDAANPVPTGIALRGIRFSPVPGSQE